MRNYNRIKGLSVVALLLDSASAHRVANLGSKISNLPFENRPEHLEMLQLHERSHSHSKKSDSLSQDEIEDVMHETFAADKPKENVPSVEQILNEEDKE